MSDTIIHVDEARAEALKEAVSSGDAPSVQAAVESAVDAWLIDQTLQHASDEALQRLWADGVASGDAGEIDFAALKQRVRGAP